MGLIRRSAVRNYIEVPPDSVIEMAGSGLATEVGDGPPKLTVDVGDGLELNESGQVCINLKRRDDNNRIQVLTNIHHNTDSGDLIVEKVFTIYEVVKTWFGLFVDLVEIETRTVTERVELPKGGYRPAVEVPERMSSIDEPNFYLSNEN